LERIERIDHLRAHLDDKTADEAFINGRIDSYSLPKALFQRLSKLVCLAFRQSLGTDHISRNFTLVLRNRSAQSAYELRQDKQTTLSSHQAERICHHWGKLHFFSERSNSSALLVTAINRTHNEIVKIGAVSQRPFQAVKVTLNGCELFRFLGQVKYGRGIACSNAGRDRSWFGHVNPFDFLAP
jgi:hypothetical protein